MPVSNEQHLEIILARPRGFCAGVERAIEIVERALERYGRPVYVRHHIVHNRHVIRRLEALGAVFVPEPEDAPEGAVLVLSAHGASPDVRARAARRGQRRVDATCPLVTKVHREAARHRREGRDILLIGHADHVEVQGTRGHAPELTQVVESAEAAASVRVHDDRPPAVLTQTTLSVDDTAEIMARLRERFPALETPRKSDICYATSNRQAGVKALARRTRDIIVVGSPESSNGRRLVETAERAGARAFPVDGPEEVPGLPLDGIASIGVTAGAAVPEVLLQQVVDAIVQRRGGRASIEEQTGIEEAQRFPITRRTLAGEIDAHG